jgi:hypothetical protein
MILKSFGPSTLRQAILMTVAYTDQFEYPLTKLQIWQRLVATANSVSTKKQFEEVLGLLVREQKLATQRGFYFLAGKQCWCAVRNQRNAWSTLKWREVRQAVGLLGWIPWLTGIWVTGSLAMNNVHQDDDIDFLLVTSPHRLWLTRLIVTFLAMLVGKHRSWKGEEQNSWCFNLWLDEAHLGVPTQKQSIYQAYEVTQAVPVVGRKTVAEAFYLENAWVQSFLPNWRQAYDLSTMDRKTRSFLGSWVLKGWWDWLDQQAYALQRWYMARHLTRERVGQGYAFFHPRDTQTQVMKAWQKALK